MQKPLLDRTILVACSAKKMVELVAGLELMGGRAMPLPVINIQEIENNNLLDESIRSLREYAWVIFTSAYAVRFFMRRLSELGRFANPAPLPAICAIGPSTAKAVEEFGYEVTLVPKQFDAEGILEALGKFHGELTRLAGKRVLIPRAQEGRDVLPGSLRSAGILTDLVPCYRTVRAEFDESTVGRLKALKPDLVVFTSSSTVRSLVDILGLDDGKKMLRESVVAVLGPVTGRTAESFGKHAEIIPKENTIPSLLAEIHSYFCRSDDCGSGV